VESRPELTTAAISRMRSAYLVLSTQYSVLSTKCSAAANLLLIALFLLIASTALGAEPPADPVQSAKDALASGGKFPWYDRQHDDVRRLNIVPRPGAEDRGDTWDSTASTTATTARTNRQFGFFGTVLQWAGLTALVVLLGLIAYLIGTAFLKEEMSEGLAVRKIAESRRDADRVEALPFHVRAAAGDFLAAARQLYEAGKYSEAIVYLFSHELVELDKHHVIRLAKGKTNRQYVRETRQRPTLRSTLEATMIAFEDAFFGHKQLAREAFERCWQRLDEFQSELDALERAAA
jgi:hypothetical protein